MTKREHRYHSNKKFIKRMNGYGIAVDVSKLRRKPMPFYSTPADKDFDGRAMRKVWFDEPGVLDKAYKPLPTHDRKKMMEIFNRRINVS